MFTKVLLTTGKAQAGKTTSCEYLKKVLERQGYTVGLYNFADSLKSFCYGVLGLEYESVYGSNEEKNKPTHIQWKNLPLSTDTLSECMGDKMYSSGVEYMTGREVLQVFGTNICRAMYSNCWVYATMLQIYNDNCDFALIADVRFPNEIESFNILTHYPQFADKICKNPYVVQLLRNPLNMDHLSETALDDFNFIPYDRTVIHNDGDLDIEVRNIDLKLVSKILISKLEEENNANK